MFFSVARLRPTTLTVLALLPALAHAHLDSLFASSVSYCAPPKSLLVNQFDIAYYPFNNTVVFNISAASVERNSNVSANLFLNVYGKQPVNITIDLCTLFNSALCPLPLYDFVGSSAIRLPKSFNIKSLVPNIAYKIPDLESFAQLTLNDTATGEQKACIQATLSNGWSTRQRAVSWATAAVALLALVLAVSQSLTRPEPGQRAMAPSRLLDLFGLYQIIGASALLNLNYPVVYRSFALNFSWALGLFAQSPSSPIQTSIDRMRNITGGHLEQTGVGGATALVNRKLSPYNVLLPPSRRALTENVLLRRDVQIVTSQSSNVLDAGVPIYVESIGIETGNAFMTVFFTALILLAITLASLGIIYAVVRLASQRRGKEQAAASAVLERQPAFGRAWLLRITLVCISPVLIFGFYQWTLRDSWLSTLLSVLSVLTVLGIVGYCSVRVFVYTRRAAPEFLYQDLPALAPLYGPKYQDGQHLAFVPPLAATFIRALVIAFARHSSPAQLALILLGEILSLITLVLPLIRHFRLPRPRSNRLCTNVDVLALVLAILRLVALGLLIAFNETIAVRPIPRVAIGIIAAVLWSIAVVLLTISLLVSAVRLLVRAVWPRARRFSALRSRSSLASARDGRAGDDGDDVRTIEKGRRNPTPSQLTPLDPDMIQHYPDVTPTTTVAAFTAPPSAASTEMSYGTPVQNRWQLGVATPSSAAHLSPYPLTPEHSSPAPSPAPPRPPSSVYSAYSPQ